MPNDTRVIEIANGEVVKKVFLVERHRINKFYQEIYGVHAARAVGICTPQILGWNDLSETPYILYERVRTEAPSALNAPAVWEIIGRTMAKTHSFKFDNKDSILLGGTSSIPAPKCTDYFTQGGGIDQQLTAVLGRGVGMEVACDLMAHVLQRLPDKHEYDPRNWYGFIHGDLHPGNVLFSVDGGIYVIDWEHAHFSDTRIDTLVTLHSARLESGEVAATAFLSGYSQGGGYVDLSKNLQTLGITKWLIDQLSFWSSRRHAQLARTGVPATPAARTLLPLSDWEDWRKTLFRYLYDTDEQQLDLAPRVDAIFESVRPLFLED